MPGLQILLLNNWWQVNGMEPKNTHTHTTPEETGTQNSTTRIVDIDILAAAFQHVLTRESIFSDDKCVGLYGD